MKKRFFSNVAIATLMLFLSAGSVFAAENSGFYVGIFGGYVMPQTMGISDPDYSVDHFDATLEHGYLLGIKNGWNTPFTRRIMAMEIEYNYMNNNFDNSKVLYIPDRGYGTLDGNMSIHALLFNVKARYPEGPIHPYIGWGLGYAFTSVGDITARESGGPNWEIWPGQSGGGFCWQFLAGVDIDITPNFGVGIGYKYFTAKPTIGSENSDGIYADLDYRASIFTLGFNFTF